MGMNLCHRYYLDENRANLWITKNDVQNNIKEVSRRGFDIFVRAETMPKPVKKLKKTIISAQSNT